MKNNKKIWISDVCTEIDVVENGIYECVFKKKKWVVENHRTDKSTPNTWYTIERTIKNICESITIEELQSYF